MDKRKYRTVFFDFDGTLVDSLPTLQNVYLGFLKSYGKQGSLDEFAELNGPSLTEIIAILKTRYNLRDSCRNLAESYSQMLLTAYRDDVNAFAGAEDILNFLRKEKLQIGLVTSASRAIVSEFLKSNNWDHYFEVTVTGDMMKHAKPHPEIYRLALRVSRVERSLCIAVEDSLHGVRAAHAAGLRVLGLCPGNPINFREAGAFETARDLHQAQQIITNQNPEDESHRH